MPCRFKGQRVAIFKTYSDHKGDAIPTPQAQSAAC